MSREQEKAMFYKIKNGKQTKINKPKSIDSYLDRGYTISKVTVKGNKTKIHTYSPRTREEYENENRGLNIRKGKKTGEWSVYKYNCPLFTGLPSKSYANKVMEMQKKQEDELRNNQTQKKK